MIAANARPKLSSKARVRFDSKTEKHLLLYPERGLELNATAAEIVKLCTGEHTVGEMARTLASRYPGLAQEEIETQMSRFLASLADRGLVRCDE